MDHVQEIKEHLDAQTETLNKSIEALNGRVDEVEAKSGTLTDGLASKAEVEKQFVNLQESIKSLNKATEELEKRTSSLNNMRIEQPGGVYKTLGEQMTDVVAAARPGASGYADAVDRLNKVNNAASGMGEAIPSDGGFLIQPTYVEELFKLAHDTGVLPQRCRQMTLSKGNSLIIPYVDETSRANGSRWGGIRAYWEGEGDLMTASKPKLGQMRVEIKKLTGLMVASDELLADAMALETFIRAGFGEEFGFRLDDAIINGTGAGQFLGIMNSPALVTVNKETGQAAATLLYENVLKMWSRMWARSRGNSIWVINQDIEPQLNAMSLAVGTGGVPVYLPAGGLSASPYGQLFGRPVIPIEQCQTLGTTGDILLVDMNQYLMVNRAAMQAASSIHVRFNYNEMTFRFILRADGQPLWKSPLTPYKGTNTQSPFIALQTRS